MSEYVISDEQIMCERRQAYEAGKRNREVWTARAYHEEEIIRCKDCKYYLHSNEKCELIDTRLHFYQTYNIWTEYSFCAWGEKVVSE